MPKHTESALDFMHSTYLFNQDRNQGCTGQHFFASGRGGAGDIFFSEGILYFIVYIQCCVECAAVDDIVV